MYICEYDQTLEEINKDYFNGVTENHGKYAGAVELLQEATLFAVGIRFSRSDRSKLSKMAQECTPEVTSRQMKFLTALLRDHGKLRCSKNRKI